MRRPFPLLLGILFLLTLALPGHAAMGMIAEFSFRDFDMDLTGQEGPFRPDGRKDAHFSVSIEGIGAVASLSVHRVSDGFEWSPRKGRGLHGVRVRDSSGNDLSNSDGSLPLLPFLGRLELEIYLPVDPGKKDTEGDYSIAVRFVDGSEATGKARLHLPEAVVSDSRKITKARFLPYPGERRNLVSPGEKPGPGGNADHGIELKLEGQGQVQAIQVKSVSGRFAAWDTLPANRRWLLGVLHGEKLLNNEDGGISFRIRGKTDLILWLEDNGAIEDGNSTFQVTVTFSDGEEIKRNIALPREHGKPSSEDRLTFMGRGERDLIGDEEKLGSNGRKDWRFRLDLNTRGTLIGLTLLGEGQDAPTWDTLPGNRVPLVAVTDAQGRLLNRQNGSMDLPLYGKTTLYLWVDGRGNKLSHKSYRAKAVFDDGRVLEFGPGNRPATESEEKTEPVIRARYLGRQDSDKVSPSEILIGDGLPDSRIRVYLEMPERGRRLKALSVEMIKKPSRSWDTLPGNGRWAILVTDEAGEILNGTDGSILIDLGRKTQLSLWLGDRGELNRTEMDFRVRAFLDDDSVMETPLLR